MARHTQWHVSGWQAVLLMPIMIPVALLAVLGEHLGLLKSTADLTPDEVVGYLENFIERRGGEWDWDDFTSIPLTDKRLDAIRDEASAVPLPLTDGGLATLRQLLHRARSEADLRNVA